MKETPRDESARYDRQVRLWGSGTQQRLQSTKVAVRGLNGMTTEVAKTLALAGVQQVSLGYCSPSQRRTCTSVDFNTNHFVYRCDVDAERPLQEALIARVGELNPLVAVVGDVTDEHDHFVVLWVSSMCELVDAATAHDNAASSHHDGNSRRVLVAMTGWDVWSLNVFLPQGDAQRMVRSLFSAEALFNAPRPFQLCALRLLVEDAVRVGAKTLSSVAFSELLQSTQRTIEQLGLASAVDDDDVQKFLDAARGQYGMATDPTGQASPIEASLGSASCTIGGSFVAQQIIARIGAGRPSAAAEDDAPPGSAGDSNPGPSVQQQPVFDWVATSAPVDGGATECYVG